MKKLRAEDQELLQEILPLMLPKKTMLPWKKQECKMLFSVLHTIN
jgi:hypothetical protein